MEKSCLVVSICTEKIGNLVVVVFLLRSLILRPPVCCPHLPNWKSFLSNLGSISLKLSFAIAIFLLTPLILFMLLSSATFLIS